MEEDPRFLTEQIVTYLGNKRSLLHFLGTGLEQVKKRLGKERLKAGDLFSGSGSLGLEALSRGGAHCVFCDNDKKSIQVIKRNVEALGFGGRSEVLFGDAFALLSLLSAEKRRFSLVLLDPPYESDFYSRAVNELVRLNLLEDGCIILAEHAFKRPPQFNCPNISCGKTHKYGDAAVTKIIYSEQREEQS